MALLLVLGPRLLPESRDPAPGRFDLTGAGLSLVMVLAAVYGLKALAVDGAGPEAIAAIALAAASGVAFVRRQRTAADPLVDLALFRRPAFGAALSANTMSIFVVGGIDLFVAQHLQLVLGMGPLEAGLWTVPPAGAFVVGSLAAPRLAAATGNASAVAGGLALSAAALASLTLVGTGTPPGLLIGAVTVMSLGVAPVLTLATDLIVAAAPPARAGAASALSETGTEFGGALGVALLGSLGTAVAGAQIGGAEGVLVTGMHAAAIGAALAMLLAALLAWRYLRPRASAVAAVAAASTPSTV
jgi:MFS transporter, DHA2 family, multidrug resistance protein